MKNLLQRNLLDWFEENKRELPWRGQADWYKTFLSEILLQQTQVEQALPYFNKISGRYPDIHSLALANEDDILTMWAGLGYYTRARNLLKAAKLISEKYNGNFPVNRKSALELPGIGQYSTSAILSIAFDQPYAVVDGNVLRVLSRLKNISDDIRLAGTHNKFQVIADKLIDKKHPGNFNEALMELGALVCIPKNPDCTICPFISFCEAYKLNKQQSLPFKSAPPARKKINHLVLLFEYKDRLLIVQRPAKGLLARMWEFPTIEIKKLLVRESTIIEKIKKKFGVRPDRPLVMQKMVHNYSHIRLAYIPIIISLEKENLAVEGNPAKKWLSIYEMNKVAIHTAHKKILSLPGVPELINN